MPTGLASLFFASLKGKAVVSIGVMRLKNVKRPRKNARSLFISADIIIKV